MTKHFTSFEELIADEDFLAWYTGSDKEKAQDWQQWLSQNPHYQPLADESIAFLGELKLREKPVSNDQVEAAHTRLMQSIDNTASVVPMHPRRTRWWLSAAAAVLIMVAGALFFKSGDSEVKMNTAYGQVSEYRLPDGSEVMLNANSKLSMKEEWRENGDREVWLQGEAFFHVKKTATKNRFIVHAEGVDIIVTGTQFNVVNRDGENSVLLKEGSVTLRTKDGEEIKMLPGDFVRISNDRPQKEAAPVEKMLAWTQAKLVFEHTPMEEVVKTISRHYGVKVVLDKEVEEEQVSGIMPNDNLEVLLKALETAKDFQITRKDKEIFIAPLKQ